MSSASYPLAGNSSEVQLRAEELANRQHLKNYQMVDRMFAVLLVVQWIGGMIAAVVISPYTWVGASSLVHVHVWISVLLGGAICSLPCAMVYYLPGHAATRHVIAVAQACFSTLLIHLTGGRIETHFHIFGSLAFLCLYRDWRVLITASAIVAIDHFVRGTWWPLSVYGIAVESPFRWIEHAAWVVFEDVVLIYGCVRINRDVYLGCLRTAQLENLHNHFDEKVAKRFEELFDATTFFQTVLDSVEARICILDTEGEIVERNAKWKEWNHHQATKDFEVGDNYIEKWNDNFVENSELASQVASAISDICKGVKNTFKSEYQLKSNGSPEWYQIVVTPMCNHSHGAAVVMHLSITERILVERRMQQQKVEADKLALVAKYTDNAVMILGSDTLIEWVNEGFSRVTEFEADEVRGTYLCDFLNWKMGDAETIAQIKSSIFSRHGFRSEHLVRKKSGIPYWASIESQPIYDSSGKVTKFIVIETDISVRKESESEMRQLNQILEERTAVLDAILESVSEGIVAADSDGIVLCFNKSAEEILGKSSKRSISLNQWAKEYGLCEVGGNQMLTVDETPLSAAMRGETVINRELIVKKDDKDTLIAVNATPLSSGGVVGGVMTFRDMSDYKLLQAQLGQAQKLESIGQLAAGISHEINTPMQFIGDNIESLDQWFSELFELIDHLENSGQPEDFGAGRQNEIDTLMDRYRISTMQDLVRDSIRDCKEGFDRVHSITKAMKEFSHPGKALRESADINRLVTSATTITRNRWKYSAKLELDLAEEISPLYCQIAEINQVLLNLVVNASDAIVEKNGESAAELGKISIRTFEEPDWICIEVHDTGCGIPDELRRRIFDPFFTTKDVGKGTGQGLAICHDVVVTKHGGQIEITSEPGESTTFCVRLPRDERSLERQDTDNRAELEKIAKANFSEDEDVIF